MLKKDVYLLIYVSREAYIHVYIAAPMASIGTPCGSQQRWGSKAVAVATIAEYWLFHRMGVSQMENGMAKAGLS